MRDVRGALRVNDTTDPRICDDCWQQLGPSFVMTADCSRLCHGCHRERVRIADAASCEATGRESNKTKAAG